MKPLLTITALTILIVALSWIALRYFVRMRSKVSVSQLEPRLAAIKDNSVTPTAFDAIYWTQMNDWHVKEQSDDRRPMFGNIAKRTGSASAHRADVRRSLQVMYKKWSAKEGD